LTRGSQTAAVTAGGESVTCADADRSETDFGKSMRILCRATHADAPHQAGGTDEPQGLFEDAERMVEGPEATRRGTIRTHLSIGLLHCHCETEIRKPHDAAGTNAFPTPTGPVRQSCAVVGN